MDNLPPSSYMAAAVLCLCDLIIQLRSLCSTLMNPRDCQFRPPIALRTDLSHITTELWEIPVLRMAH